VRGYHLPATDLYIEPVANFLLVLQPPRYGRIINRLHYQKVYVPAGPLPYLEPTKNCRDPLRSIIKNPANPLNMICVIDDIVELTAAAIESREEDFEKIIGTK